MQHAALLRWKYEVAVHRSPLLGVELKGRFGGHRLRRRFNQLLQAVDLGVGVLRLNPCARRAHVLRIHIKKLRYTAELLALAYPVELEPLLPRLTQFQCVLGDMHDCVVRVDWLRRNRHAGAHSSAGMRALIALALREEDAHAALLPGLLHAWSQAAFEPVS